MIRDTILPCLPSRRTCHAGEWVGSLPSCAPFEFCPSVPRIQNGYLATPREDLYRLHSIIKYGCDRYVFTLKNGIDLIFGL